MEKLAESGASESSEPRIVDEQPFDNVGDIYRHQQVCDRHVGNQRVHRVAHVRGGGHNVDDNDVANQRRDDDDDCEQS